MEKLLKSLLISLTLLCILFGLIYFIVDHKSVGQNFLAQVKNIKFNTEHVKTKINLLPIPHLVIDNLKSEDGIELENVKLRLSFLSLFTFNPKVKQIKISSAKITTSNNSFSISNHDRAMIGFIHYFYNDFDINIDNLVLVDHSKSTINIDDLTFTKDTKDSNAIIFSGAIHAAGTISGHIKKSAENMNFQLDVTNSEYEIRLSENYNNSILLNGNVVCKIKNLSYLIKNYLPNISEIIGINTQNENIEVKFDITSDDSLLKLQTIKIKSDSVVGDGQVTLSRNDNAATKIALNFSKIDLKSLFSKEIASLAKEKIILGRFIIPNHPTQTEINVDQILLKNDDKIEGANLAIDSANGKFFIRELSGKIASGGKFKLEGIITQNTIRSIFEGKAFLEHSDFNNILKIFGHENATIQKVAPFAISADVKSTSVDLSLQNILFKIGNTTITGNISNKLIGATPRVKSSLHFSPVNLDSFEYPIITPILRFIKNLVGNENNTDYSKSFAPIRNISYQGFLDLTFDNVILEDTDLGLVNMSVSFAPSQINLESLYINKKENYLRLSGQLLTNNLKPQLAVQINDGIFPVNFLSPKSFLEIRDILLSKFKLDKISVQLNCKLTKIFQNNLVLENVVFDIQNDNNLLKYRGNTHLLGGALELDGSVLLDSFTWNLVYGLNAVSLSELTKLIPPNLIPAKGLASLNGMITTNGDNLEKMLFRLYTKSSFVTRNVSIDNFSIDTLVENVSNKDFDIKNLDKNLKDAISTGTTQFNNIDGTLELTEGIILLKDTTFRTKYTVGAASALINIYDLVTNFSSIFSFNAPEKQKNDYSYSTNSKSLSIGVKATGPLIKLEKTIDSTQLLEFLQKSKSSNMEIRN